MAYFKKELVQKCLDNLSNENLIGNDNDTYISLAEAKDKIEELPAADVVEVKHGQWQVNELKHTKNKFITCSLCDSVIDCNWTHIDENEFDYCPYCGAKMNGKPQKGVLGMAYIDTKYLGKCETCRHCIGEFGCNTFCDSGECYSPNLSKIPTADVVEVVRCKDCKFNVANMEKDPLDITDYSGDDIVCSYFMTDGLGPNDYCSQGKPQKEV